MWKTAVGHEKNLSENGLDGISSLIASYPQQSSTLDDASPGNDAFYRQHRRLMEDDYVRSSSRRHLESPAFGHNGSSVQNQRNCSCCNDWSGSSRSSSSQGYTASHVTMGSADSGHFSRNSYERGAPSVHYGGFSRNMISRQRTIDRGEHNQVHPNPYAAYRLPDIDIPAPQFCGGSHSHPANPYADNSLSVYGDSHHSRNYSVQTNFNSYRSGRSNLHDRGFGMPFKALNAAVNVGPGSNFTALTEPCAAERRIVPRNELEMLSRFGETGGQPGQLDSPHGFCLGLDGEIIVADTMNNRIQIFDQKGTLILFWGNGGSRRIRLWQPRKVAFIEGSNRIVVSDRGREWSRLQIFTRDGDFVRVVRQVGSALSVGLTVYKNQDCPKIASMDVPRIYATKTSLDYFRSNCKLPLIFTIVAVENLPSACIVMTQEGLIVKRFCLENIMKEPSDILVVSQQFYICDFLGHTVCVFDWNGNLTQRIGSDYPGIIFFPNGIDISDTGDVVVADTHGNRFHVSVWSQKGNLLADYELPHMKVSRCCGLFLTGEGNLITAATNNNIVLITNLIRVPDIPASRWDTNAVPFSPRGSDVFQG